MPRRCGIVPNGLGLAKESRIHASGGDAVTREIDDNVVGPVLGNSQIARSGSDVIRVPGHFDVQVRIGLEKLDELVQRRLVLDRVAVGGHIDGVGIEIYGPVTAHPNPPADAPDINSQGITRIHGDGLHGASDGLVGDIRDLPAIRGTGSLADPIRHTGREGDLAVEGRRVQ